jgi:agmatinase
MADNIETYIYDTFLGLPPEDSNYENSRTVLIRVPYDGTTSYGSGARNGPAAIMAASTQVEFYDLELEREPCAVGIHTLPALLPSALGPGDMIDRVEQACLGPISDGKFVFTLGGEHSVSLGAVKALARHHEKFSILQIDAHLDLRDTYEGSPFSHACVARRLAELGSLVQVGVRTGCPEEIQAIIDLKLKPLWGYQIPTLSQSEWIQRTIEQLSPKVYVTVDVDGLDPSVIPATGTPVPGGLSWYQLLALLRSVGEQRQVIGCDLCELAPIPGQHASDFAAALLVYKMIGYFVH